MEGAGLRSMAPSMCSTTVFLLILIIMILRSAHLRNNGFTLLELVLMISLLGIMVVFFVESAGNLSDVSIDAGSRKVQSDIRYAQQLSLSSGVTHGVVFTANDGYEVYANAPGNPILNPATGRPMVETFDNFPGVSVAASYRIEFNGKGVPTIGGDERIRLAATSGALRDVYVVDQTGAVVVDFIQAGTGCNCELCYK